MLGDGFQTELAMRTGGALQTFLVANGGKTA